MADRNVQILADREDIVAIADAVRNKTGTSGEMTLGGIASSINNISTGAALPTLNNEGIASELFADKELIDSEGNVVTGTFTIDSELTTQDNLISQIQTALQSKVSATPILQTKTVTPTTSTQNVVPDSGYDGLGNVIVNAIPNTYVKPTTTKGATTYTPSTSNQTIAAGTYCSGAQTIEGDSNLVASNIKSGVSIFGVTGSYAGSGGSSGGEDGPGRPSEDGPSRPSEDGPSRPTEDPSASLPTVRSGFVASTAEGSIIYPVIIDGSITTSQNTLIYMSMLKKYRHPLDAALLANTPIIVLTSGTITMPPATGYTCETIATGTGYGVYQYVPS